MQFPYRKHVLGNGLILWRPEISIFVQSGENRQTVGPCLVDSGSDYCIFPLAFAELFQHKIDPKKKIKNAAAGGDVFHIYPSPNTVEFLIGQPGFRRKSWKSLIYYAERQDIILLGRYGFFDQFDQIIFDSKQKSLMLKDF